MQLLLVTKQLQSFWIPYSLSLSYMVVVKQIAPVGFPTGACLLKRYVFSFGIYYVMKVLEIGFI